MSQILLLAILGLVPLYALFEASSYVNMDAGNYPVGPAGFPSAVAIFILALIILQIIRVLLKSEKPKAKFLSLFKGPPGVFLLSLVLYGILFKYLGFLITTCMLTVFLQGFFSYKKDKKMHWRNALVGSLLMVLFTGILFFAFKNLLGITLPLPIWY